jgi:ribonuclease G
VKDMQVVVHPIVAAYLTKGWWFNSILASWKKRFKIRIELISSSNNALLEYKFFDKNGESLTVK